MALVLTMLMAGCLGIGEEIVEPEPVETKTPTLATGNWELNPASSIRNPVAGDLLIFEVEGIPLQYLESVAVGDVRTTHDMGVPEVVRDVAVSRTDVLVVAIMARQPVVQVSIDLMPEGDVLFDGGPFTLETTVEVGQAGVRLVLPVAAVADEGTIAIQGQVAALRDRPEQDLASVSCSVVMDLGAESGIEDVMLDETRSFTINMAEEGLPPVLVFTATCVGPIDTAIDERSVRLILSELVVDADGDGVHDDLDLCPNGVGETEGWTSKGSTDHDGDGCRDRDEDEDDDNDGISDALDGCLSEPGGRQARLRSRQRWMP